MFTGGDTLSSFSGTWRGTCLDGNVFVILNLKVTEKDLAGDIGIANMNGDNGQCNTVIDPPGPAHAMKITGAHLDGKTLSFQGSPQARFEMSLAGDQSAKLKFLAMPVEDSPWELKGSTATASARQFSGMPSSRSRDAPRIGPAQ
jgi:hypothetical protein